MIKKSRLFGNLHPLSDPLRRDSGKYHGRPKKRPGKSWWSAVAKKTVVLNNLLIEGQSYELKTKSTSPSPITELSQANSNFDSN